MISQASKKMIEQIISNLANLKLHRCGIAVSGGSDSMALLHILTDWESATKPNLFVASIDHGLRSGSKSEVEFVKKICVEKKVEHVSLVPTVQLLKAQGNLQDNARSARYELLKNWAFSKNLQCICIGHTLDDQEENLLMRFFRGSGVDGLVSMENIVLRNEILWIRPLLKSRKEDLRNYLRDNNYSWIDDPSNFDDKYQRVKVRKLLQFLKSRNLIASNFVKTADHMLRASKLCKETAISSSKSLLSFNDIGQITFEVEKFSSLFEDTQYRILAGIISWFSGSFYKPRFSQLENIFREIINKKNLSGATLGGTVFKKKSGIVTVTRELASVKENHPVKKEKFIWDNRWLVKFKSGVQPHLCIKPYGLISSDESKFCVDSDFDKVALRTIPVIMLNKSIKFVPLSNLKYSVEVKLLKQDKEFYKFF